MVVYHHRLPVIGWAYAGREYVTKLPLNTFIKELSREAVDTSIATATLVAIDRLANCAARIEQLIEGKLRDEKHDPVDPVSAGVASWVQQCRIANPACVDGMIEYTAETTLGELARTYLKGRARKAIYRKGLWDAKPSALVTISYMEWSGMREVGAITLAELASFGDRLGVAHNCRFSRQ